MQADFEGWVITVREISVNQHVTWSDVLRLKQMLDIWKDLYIMRDVKNRMTV